MGLTVAVGLAGTTWLIVEPRYRADSFVRVREQQSVIFSPQATQLLGNQLQNQLIEHQKRVAVEVVEQSLASDASIQQHLELISARKQLADVELQLEQKQSIAASAA